MRNVTDAVDGFLTGHWFLICDRGSNFSAPFTQVLKSAGVDPIWAPYQAPNCNKYAERLVLSIRPECLQRMIFFGEALL
jgi:hypothetical protein